MRNIAYAIAWFMVILAGIAMTACAGSPKPPGATPVQMDDSQIREYRDESRNVTCYVVGYSDVAISCLVTGD